MRASRPPDNGSEHPVRAGRGARRAPFEPPRRGPHGRPHGVALRVTNGGTTRGCGKPSMNPSRSKSRPNRDDRDPRVSAILRMGIDKVVSRKCGTRPFVLVHARAEGVRHDHARAIIDVSGTWQTPNPLGAGGLLAEGEAAFTDRIAYGIPDILGRARRIYARRTVLVVGSDHFGGQRAARSRAPGAE